MAPLSTAHLCRSPSILNPLLRLASGASLRGKAESGLALKSMPTGVPGGAISSPGQGGRRVPCWEEGREEKPHRGKGAQKEDIFTLAPRCQPSWGQKQLQDTNRPLGMAPATPFSFTLSLFSLTRALSSPLLPSLPLDPKLQASSETDTIKVAHRALVTIWVSPNAAGPLEGGWDTAT